MLGVRLFASENYVNWFATIVTSVRILASLSALPVAETSERDDSLAIC